jgi:hypothetical protein
MRVNHEQARMNDAQKKERILDGRKPTIPYLNLVSWISSLSGSLSESPTFITNFFLSLDKKRIPLD